MRPQRHNYACDFVGLRVFMSVCTDHPTKWNFFFRPRYFGRKYRSKSRFANFVVQRMQLRNYNRSAHMTPIGTADKKLQEDKCNFWPVYIDPR